MNKQEKHDYLITLIKELEKAGNETNLNNFIIVLEDTLKVKYRLRNYFDYPISAADYDELITYAENLLGVNRMGSKDDPHYETLEGIKYGGPSPAIETYSCFCINGIEVGSYHYNEDKSHYEFYDSNNQLLATISSEPIKIFTIYGNESWNKLASLFGDTECCVKHTASGRTTPTTGGPGASSDVDSFNTMSDIEVEALVDYALNENKKTIDEWIPNAETIAALEEAANAYPKDLHSWEDVKKEFYGDETDPNFQKYWGKGEDVHWFYSDEFEIAWKCADIWHRDIYYWPYNAQIIVGQINPVEWYKTKGDELEWGPIFGPFENPDQLSAWIEGFWKWWHRLSDENKVVYHNIPNVDSKWPMWNTNYIEMFRHYAATNEYDYHKIAADAQNDGYSKMTNEDYDKLYGAEPKAFTEQWNERVAAFIGNIKSIESNLDNSENTFDGEIIHDLEQKLLDFLKKTL
jgi:hypothetical protein